jgi:hypothetical protein
MSFAAFLIPNLYVNQDLEGVMKCFRIPQYVALIVCAIFFAPSVFSQTNPEPSGWYAGDMHVHRSCGSSPEAVSTMFSKMSPNNLSAMSLLADMGNGEVQNPVTDLPLVNGKEDPKFLRLGRSSIGMPSGTGTRFTINTLTKP